MNVVQELKLQAWVDGELSQRETDEVARLVAADQRAAGLVDELRMTNSLLSGNELTRALPESREFFWSKVGREIQRSGASEQGRLPALGWTVAWRWFVAPVSGVALVVLLSVFSMNISRDGNESSTNQRVEVENLSDEVGSISYRSQSDNVFVVYLYDRERGVDGDAVSSMTEESKSHLQ